MWQLPLVGGAIVPHAPLLLPEISGPTVSSKVAEVVAGLRAITLDATAIVLASPHGPERGIYAGRRGDLDDFGRAGVSVETTSADDLAGELGRTWHAPTLGAPLDHGIVTPLALGLMPDKQVVCVSVGDPDDGRRLAEVVAGVAEHRSTKVAFVASGHLGAALTERAPKPLDPAALDLDDAVVAGLTEDAAILERRAGELEDVGASCSAGVLAAFGVLFAGKPASVAAYARPFGVGYAVATVDA